MNKPTFFLPESRIARRLVVTLSVTVNAERECVNLDKYVGQALLEAANRVDVQGGSVSDGTLSSRRFDHSSVEVHVGYSATSSRPADGPVHDSSGSIQEVCGNVVVAEPAIKAVAGEFYQASQREILEQSLVHGAAREVASCPSKAGSIAGGIKTLLNVLHPLSEPLDNGPAVTFRDAS